MTQRVLISRDLTPDFETVDRLLLVFMQDRGFTLDARRIGMGRRDLEFTATDRARPPKDHRAFAQAVADQLERLPGVLDVECYSSDQHLHAGSFAMPAPPPTMTITAGVIAEAPPEDFVEPVTEDLWKGGDAYGVHFEDAGGEDESFVVWTSAEGDEVPLTPPEAVAAAMAVLRRFAPETLKGDTP